MAVQPERCGLTAMARVYESGHLLRLVARFLLAETNIR